MRYIARLSVLLGLFLFSTNTQADVEIFTFEDRNNNGLRENNEPLIHGLEVTAFDQFGQELSFLDDGAGHHTLPGILIQSRLRVVVRGYDGDQLRQGKHRATTVFFVVDGDEVEVPVVKEEALDPNATNILIPCYEKGAALGSNDSPAFVRFPFASQGVAAQFGGDGPDPKKDATIGEIGSTWGVTYQRSFQRAYASAILKRHVGLGPKGEGAIYVMDYSSSEIPAVHAIDLQGITPAIGPTIDLGTVRREIVDVPIDESMPYALSTVEDLVRRASYDVDAFDNVGKMSFGDIEMGEDGRTLWMVNLNQRSLIAMDVGDADVAVSSENLQHFPMDDLSGLPNLNFRFRRCVNAGGNSNINGAEAFTDPEKVAWDKNKYSLGGLAGYSNFAVANTMNDLESTSSPELYQTYKKGDFSYQIPVPEDEIFQVFLHFAEPENLVEGDRLFDIMSDDQLLVENFDIVKFAGAARTAAVLELAVASKDKNLNIRFVSKFGAKRKEALLAGYEVVGKKISQSGVLRPWGLAFHKGKGYLGVVSDASISQSRDHLFAYLLSFDPHNVAAGFHEELAFPLGYPRERASNANLKTPQPLRSAAWEPWVHSWNETMIPTKGEPLNVNNGLLCAYAQPIFSKINFTSDGSIVIGLMDKWAHQLGHNNYSTNVGDRTFIIGYASGDILKAFREDNGTYTMEKSNSDDGKYYRKDDGPSYKGEFFYEDNYIAEIAHHGEIITGGMMILPGSDEIAATVHNPRVTDIPHFQYQGLFSQGLHFYNTTTGKRTRDYLFVDQYILGKANGLGDISLVTAALPPGVGNYVWCDANGNGIQDPTEYGIDGIRVKLLDLENEREVLGEVTTSSGGQYFFDNLLPNNCYEVQIDLSDLVARGFSGLVSPAHETDSLYDSDGIDSLIAGLSIIRFCSGNEGLNRDDLDFGFLGPEALDGKKIQCEDLAIMGMGIPCADFLLEDVASCASEVSNTDVRIFPSANDAINMTNEIMGNIRVCGPDSMVYARVFVNGDLQCYAISQIDLIVQPYEGSQQIHFVELICPTDPFDAIEFLHSQGFRGDASTEFFLDSERMEVFLGDPSAIDVNGEFPFTLYYDDTVSDGGCPTGGSLTLSEVPSSLIYAGRDTVICGLQCVDLGLIGADFDPNGSGAIEAVWSTSGSGSFVEDNSYAGARFYCPGQADLEAGQVILTLTVIDDPCMNPPPSSSVHLTITNGPPEPLPHVRDTIDCFHPFAMDQVANDTFVGCRLLADCVDTLVGEVVDYDLFLGDCEDIVLQIKRTLRFRHGKEEYFCMDTISVRGLTDTLICPPEKDSVYCDSGYLKDENGHPSPAETGFPTSGGIPLWPPPPSVCDISIHYKDIVFSGECPVTIRRNWAIKDNCTGTFEECVQWIMVFDTVGPIITKLDTAGFFISLNKNSHECFAEVMVPKIMAEDTCTGIVQVKAGIDGQMIEMTYNALTGYYESSSKIKVPVADLDFSNEAGQISYVKYELLDACHNRTKLDSLPLLVVDAVKPVAICDKGINLTVSDSIVWLSASAFDEGSWDNCGISLLLVRRSDWATACGVDLCDGDASFLGATAHGDSLFIANLDENAYIDPVEAHYRNAIDWLCEDGRACTYPLLMGWAYDLIKYASLDCREHPYPVDASYLDHLLHEMTDIAGFDSLLTSIIPCIETDGDSLHLESYQFLSQHSELLKILLEDLAKIGLARDLASSQALRDIGKDIGGGWSTQVPFCCEDACQSVMVEVLVMDYWCNWSKCWTMVNVEDKTPPSVVSELSDLTVTCTSYKTFYGDAVASALEGDFTPIQEQLGNYDKVKFDAYGKVPTPRAHTIFDIKCDSSLIETDSLIYDEHLGYIWKTFHRYRNAYDTTSSIRFNGQVADNCGLQSWEGMPWVNIDACGKGYVKRVFYFVGQCANEGAGHLVDTIVKFQTIWINPDCDISLSMFDLPGDTVVYTCGIVNASDGSGAVSGEADASNTGFVTYDLSRDCREIGIGYYDKVYKIVGGGPQGCYKIIRTWCLADWCGWGQAPISGSWWYRPELKGKFLTYAQQIIIKDTIGSVVRFDLPEKVTASGCMYDLAAIANVDAGCGAIEYRWSLTQEKSGEVIASSSGVLGDVSNEGIKINVAGLGTGTYKLRLISTDECLQEGVGVHVFEVLAQGKPQPVCVTSLTTELTPMDLNSDGTFDTAMATIWANEFNRSSIPACGSTGKLSYRIDAAIGDPVLPSSKATSITVGCADVGTKQVRMYVVDASGSWDFCDVLLVVQNHMQGCQGVNEEGQTNDITEVPIPIDIRNPKGGRPGKSIEIGAVLSPGHSTSEGFELLQNFPNPFYDQTEISFSVPETMEVQISITDMAGKHVYLLKGIASKGHNAWSISDVDFVLPTGVLYYRMNAGEFTQVKKMIRIR